MLFLSKILPWRLMKTETKIQLLPFELELLSDAGLLLTKNAILQKLKDFLLLIEARQKEIIKNHPLAFPPEVLKIPAKISRGENYKGLPWLVLDYPRYFEQHNVFAIRTMFWWGNFFSCTLHLSGRHKEKLQYTILEKKECLIKSDFFLCINPHEWEHHFEPENYVLIKNLSPIELEKTIIQKPFLKIASRFTLAQMMQMEEKLCRSYSEIIKLFG